MMQKYYYFLEFEFFYWNIFIFIDYAVQWAAEAKVLFNILLRIIRI